MNKQFHDTQDLENSESDCSLKGLLLEDCMFPGPGLN